MQLKAVLCGIPHKILPVLWKSTMEGPASCFQHLFASLQVPLYSGETSIPDEVKLTEEIFPEDFFLCLHLESSVLYLKFKKKLRNTITKLPSSWAIIAQKSPLVFLT